MQLEREQRSRADYSHSVEDVRDGGIKMHIMQIDLDIDHKQRTGGQWGFFVPTAEEDRYIPSAENSCISCDGDLTLEYSEDQPDMTCFG